MSEQFAAPLFTGDHHGPTPVVSFFSTQEYSGLIELFPSPYASSLCCLNISVFLRPIDSFIRSDDPRVSVRRGCHTIPTFIYSPHRLHCDHSGLFAFFFFRLRRSTMASSTYPENPTRLIFSRASHSVLSFPLVQPYLSIPDPKPEQCGSSREKFLSLFG